MQMRSANPIDTTALVLLDTHVLVWLDRSDPKLGNACQAAADRALASDQLVVSAASFWEVAMLVRKGRLEMDLSVREWRGDLLGRGLRELTMDGEIGARAVELPNLHDDPMDGIIAATAEIRGCVLATGDHRLLAWDTDIVRIDARR